MSRREQFIIEAKNFHLQTSCFAEYEHQCNNGNWLCILDPWHKDLYAIEVKGYTEACNILCAMRNGAELGYRFGNINPRRGEF